MKESDHPDGDEFNLAVFNNTGILRRDKLEQMTAVLL